MEREQTRNKFKIENVPNIVQRLYDGLLITKEEKLKMEVLPPTEMKAAVFDLVSQKDSKVAVKIFLAIRSVKDEQEEEERLRNPMEINTIVRNIFGFLKVEDLKSCRAVCKIWDLEAEPLLRKIATITFGHSDLQNPITTLRHPENFVELFHHFSASRTNQPFTSFRFLKNVEWRASDLKNFFDQQKNNVKDLQLCGLNIFNEDRNMEEQYDIFLPNLKFLKLSQPYDCLKFFANCSNLWDIEIHNTKNLSPKLNVEWIPKSVTRMKLNGIGSIIGSNCNKLKLEKLILENYSVANAAKVLDKISPNILVLQWEREFETSESVLLLLWKYNYLRHLVVFIGPFIWDNTIDVFEKSPLCTHVDLDRKAEYYVFENNQGRSIQQKEFDDMTILDKKSNFS